MIVRVFLISSFYLSGKAEGAYEKALKYILIGYTVQWLASSFK
jgi:hypothetical protein